MTARLLMSATQVEQYPEQWKQTRIVGITASEVAAMLGICHPEHGSPFALYVAKTDPEAEDVGDKDAMARGRHLEPYVAERFAADRPELAVLDGGLYCSAERPWQMATFDRLALDLDRTSVHPGLRHTGYVNKVRWEHPEAAYPVEIKTANDYEGWGEPGSADVPDAYRAQAIMQMDVWEAELVLIPVLFMLPWRLSVYAIRRTMDVEEDIRLIRAECERFLNRVADNDPPPIDWTPATTRALKTIMPARKGTVAVVPARVRERYRTTWQRLEAAKQAHALACNQLRAASGGADRIIGMVNTGGDPRTEVEVAQRRVFKQHRLDEKQVRRAYPDVAAACEKEIPVDGLWPGKWTKEAR